jgi:hypothetical protein
MKGRATTAPASAVSVAQRQHRRHHDRRDPSRPIPCPVWLTVMPYACLGCSRRLSSSLMPARNRRTVETLERLEKKLKGYEYLQIASGYAYRVLFRFGHPRREAGARRALAEATVPVATAAPGPTHSGRTMRCGRQLGHDGCRTRLAELAGVPYPPESYRRIEETHEHCRRIDERRRRDCPDRYGEA